MLGILLPDTQVCTTPNVIKKYPVYSKPEKSYRKVAEY